VDDLGAIDNLLDVKSMPLAVLMRLARIECSRHRQTAGGTQELHAIAIRQKSNHGI
jgi:hypothetical protein